MIVNKKAPSDGSFVKFSWKTGLENPSQLSAVVDAKVTFADMTDPTNLATAQVEGIIGHDLVGTRLTGLRQTN